MKLLLAEDTEDLNRAITAILTHSGYTVDPVFNGEEALSHLEKDSFDGVVLDIMMPKMDGMEVLEKMRGMNITTPVLMLTAKAEVDDRVAGLDAGADDYLTKPFAMKELLARIRAMVRRKTDYSGENLAYGDTKLDAASFELKAENSVRLSIKEFELMQMLIMNADRELDTQYILDHVWKNEKEANADTVYLYISYLRGKLKSIASNLILEGEKGARYRLINR